MTIDKKHKYLKMVGNDICSKDGKKLLNVVSGKKNYKVPKGVKEISAHAFWGNTAIETLHVRKKMCIRDRREDPGKKSLKLI